MGSSGARVSRKALQTPSGQVEADFYFTDGVNLFRVANVTSGPQSRKLIELEDCRTLEMSTCGSETFMASNLVAVMPEPPPRSPLQDRDDRPVPSDFSTGGEL